jgi:hypothetical protein
MKRSRRLKPPDVREPEKGSDELEPRQTPGTTRVNEPTQDSTEKHDHSSVTFKIRCKFELFITWVRSKAAKWAGIGTVVVLVLVFIIRVASAAF